MVYKNSRRMLMTVMTAMLLIVFYKFYTTMTVGWLVSMILMSVGYLMFWISNWRQNMKEIKEKSKIRTVKKHG